MSDIKYMDIKEFRELGYLQYVNRSLLHPLGLALEIIQNEDGTEIFGGIWDHRKDKEGIYYDLKNSNDERIENFTKKDKFIADEIRKRFSLRYEKLGFWMEPIPYKNEETNS